MKLPRVVWRWGGAAVNLLVLIQSEVCSLSDTRLRKFAVKSKILKNGRFV